MAFPSTFADLYNEVIAKVRLDATADLQKTKDWINQTYAEVCIETEATQDFATMSLTANTSTYTLSTSILRVNQMYVTPTGQQASRPLIPTSLEQILEWSAANGATVNATSSSVTHYALFGTQNIYFYPTPVSADVVTIFYVKLPTALSGDSDVPVLQEPYVSACLVNGACYKAALFLKDPDAAVFQRDYEVSKQNLRAHLRRKSGTMTRQFRITRGDRLIPHDPSVDIRYA